jgi:hypothetical protein
MSPPLRFFLDLVPILILSKLSLNGIYLSPLNKIDGGGSPFLLPTVTSSEIKKRIKKILNRVDLYE